MNEVKDSIANIATIGSIGMSMMQIQNILTVAILVTALWLNIQRILANRRKAQKEKDQLD